MSELVGDQIFNSQETQDLIHQLVSQVGSLNKTLEGVRPPQASKVQDYETAMKEIGKNRGRDLFYPYIGSGAGHGSLVELCDGSVKLDLINGIGIHLLGHQHPEVLKAGVRGALSDIMNQGNLQPNREYQDLGGKLVEWGSRNSRLQHCWLTTSGSMANEIALKISRQKNTPARKILAFNAAFAGRTTMMAEVTDNPAFRVGQPEYGEVLRLPFYDANDPQSSEKTLQELKKHIDENKGDISVFVFEPVQGEGGFNSAPREFFVPLLEMCRENGIAVWSDEVQTFCRTGERFAFETLGFGEYVDIATVAKTVQVGATLYTSEYNPQPGLVAGTFSGSSPALAAGHRILSFLDEGGYFGPNGKIQEVHQKFTAMLKDLSEGSCKGLLGDVGGLGLMVAATPYDGDKPHVMKLLKVLFKNGLMAFSCGRGSYRLRFLLPATLKDSEIEIAREILDKSLHEAR